MLQGARDMTFKGAFDVKNLNIVDDDDDDWDTDADFVVSSWGGGQ